MSEPTLDTLTSRLDRLERELRWWRVAGIGVLCISSVIVLMAATKAQVPAEIKAKRIAIVDDLGNPRIVLGKASDEEKFGLTLLRSKGVAVGELFTREIGQGVQTALALNDLKGNPHVHVIMYSDANFDRSKVWLLGKYQIVPGTSMETSPESISLQVESDRDPAHKEGGLKPSTASLSLRTGKAGSSFWVDGQSAHLTFDNFVDEPPVGVIAADKGGLSLGLFDGMPALTLSDGLRGPALGLGHASLPPISIKKGSAASLVLFDKDGKVWKAP